MFEVERALFRTYGVSDELHRELLGHVAGGIDEAEYGRLCDDHDLTELLVNALMRTRTIMVMRHDADTATLARRCNFSDVTPNDSPLEGFVFRHRRPPALPGYPFRVRLVRDNGSTLAAQERQLYEAGHRPATIQELLCFHIDHPEFPLDTSALGSVEEQEDQRRYAITRVGGGGRDLSLIPSSYHPRGSLYHLTVV